MALQYTGINVGDSKSGVATSSSTTSKMVEVVVNESLVLTKQDVLRALDNIKASMAEGVYPHS